VEYEVDSDVGQILVANQRRRWVHQDYDEIVMTNSAGFHDREHTISKPEGVYRIVVVGDSFIEALSSPIESGFSWQLEKLLQHDLGDKRVEVINLAVGGSGPAQYLRRLEVKGIAYRPDLVIMSVFPDNDFWDSYEPLSRTPSKVFYRLQPDGSLRYVPVDGSWTTMKARQALRKSGFLRLLRAGITLEKSMQLSEWGVYLADHPEPWPDAYRTTLQCIKSAFDLASRRGAKFTVMLIASVTAVEERWDEAVAAYPEAKSLKWDFDYPVDIITASGRQVGFDVINLVAPFRENFLATKISQFWPHDGHWNRSGNKLAAEYMARYLLAHRTQYDLPN